MIAFHHGEHEEYLKSMWRLDQGETSQGLLKGSFLSDGVMDLGVRPIQGDLDLFQLGKVRKLINPLRGKAEPIRDHSQFFYRRVLIEIGQEWE